jgi:hypothetical protein
MNMQIEDYITGSEAARTLGVSRGAITYFRQIGSLKSSVKIGHGTLLLKRSEVEALKARRATNERSWINGIPWGASR